MNYILDSIAIAGIMLAMIVVQSCGTVKVESIDFSCTSRVEGQLIITNCADLKSWERYMEQQQENT